jgi:hypothetical protein
MKVRKKFEMFSGTTIRKCPIEHFTPAQFMYGSPYSYIFKYEDYAGGTPERRYGLWKFNDKTLKYKLFQTAGEKDYSVLSEIAGEWENAMRDARHIENLKTMPRSFWSDSDQVKYAHIKTIKETDGQPIQKVAKKQVQKQAKTTHTSPQPKA